MEINIKKVLDLIDKNFRSNKTWFAEEIGLDSSYLNGILNNKKPSDSKKACECIVNYCKKNNLDYKEYIFLP